MNPAAMRFTCSPIRAPAASGKSRQKAARSPCGTRTGELFYRSGDKMMAVDINTQPGFSAGTPSMLFEGQYVPTPATLPNHDVSPDGQRFLMLKSSESAGSATQINVVLNWFEELKRRVPTGAK